MHCVIVVSLMCHHAMHQLFFKCIFYSLWVGGVTFNFVLVHFNFFLFLTCCAIFFLMCVM